MTRHELGSEYVKCQIRPEAFNHGSNNNLKPAGMTINDWLILAPMIQEQLQILH
jgi:hypothetical protein